MDQLNQILGREKSTKSVWLILATVKNRSELKDVFKRTPLRLDSEVYAIVKENYGKSKRSEIPLYASLNITRLIIVLIERSFNLFQQSTLSLSMMYIRLTKAPPKWKQSNMANGIYYLVL